MMEFATVTTREEAEEQIKNAELSHAELADTLLFLTNEGYSSIRLSQLMNVSDDKVRHYIRLAKRLCPNVKWMLHENKINYSMARVIAGYQINEQEREARKALSKRTSVHKKRNEQNYKKRYNSEAEERQYNQLEEEISMQTGFPSEIKPDTENRRAGYVTLRYTSMEELSAICERLRVDLDMF